MSKLSSEYALDLSEILASAPVFRKREKVRARPTGRGEIFLITFGGAAHRVKASVDGWIVNEESAGRKFCTDEDFHVLYEITETNGVYRPRGHCVAVKNPIGKSVQISASEKGDKDCMIAQNYHPEIGKRYGSPYIMSVWDFQRMWE